MDEDLFCFIDRRSNLSLAQFISVYCNIPNFQIVNVTGNINFNSSLARI